MRASSHSTELSSLQFPNTPIERIAIMVAMPEEAQPLIDALKFEAFDFGFDADYGLKSYKTLIQEREVFLVVNDYDPHFSTAIMNIAPVGTDFAAIGTYQVLEKIKPDTIISAGTAGGYAERGAEVGDVYIAEGSFGFHDQHIECGLEYSNYGLNHVPCLEAPVMASALKLKTGIISTGHSLSVSAQDQRTLHAIGASAKEMEVGTIANIARRKKVRVLGLKAITNLVSTAANAGEEFQKNFALAVKNLAEALPKVLRFILGKTPQQLSTPITLLVNNSVVCSSNSAIEYGTNDLTPGSNQQAI